MKKVISLLLTAVMALSSLTVAFAAEVPTVTVADLDATAIEDNGYVILPVTVDKFPEGSLKIVELEFTFDNTKLAFVGAYAMDMSGNTAMQVLNKPTPVEATWTLKDATWTSTAAATVNANGFGKAMFSDTTGTSNNLSAAKSLAVNKTFVYLWFTKVAGATGTTTVDFREIYMADTATNAGGTDYFKSANQIKSEAGTVTFTAGPTKKVEVAGYFTGDKETDGDNADTTDTTAAIYAQLIPADADTVYTKVNWSVTATEDGTANSAAKTQEYEQTGLDLSGEATYKVGLVIRGLAANVITAVDAALAQ